jgi:hypothetical protein
LRSGDATFGGDGAFLGDGAIFLAFGTGRGGEKKLSRFKLNWGIKVDFFGLGVFPELLRSLSNSLVVMLGDDDFRGEGDFSKLFISGMFPE